MKTFETGDLKVETFSDGSTYIEIRTRQPGGPVCVGLDLDQSPKLAAYISDRLKKFETVRALREEISRLNALVDGVRRELDRVQSEAE